jgi:HEAT repeat protein
MLRAVVAPRREVSNPLDAVIEAWTEVLRWRDERLQMKRGVASWLGLIPPASPKTIEGLKRALDDPETDIRLWARHGLARSGSDVVR